MYPNIFDIRNYTEITRSVMPKPVYLLTVQEAYKEYNSLTDQMQAKYEQLDSGELKPANWLIYLLV